MCFTDVFSQSVSHRAEVQHIRFVFEKSVNILIVILCPFFVDAFKSFTVPLVLCGFLMMHVDMETYLYILKFSFYVVWVMLCFLNL